MNLDEMLRNMPPDYGVYDMLASDVGECVKLLASKPKDQFLRRIYVRSNLAMVEGTNSLMRRAMYSYHERNIRPVHTILKVLGVPFPSPVLATVQPETALLLLLDRVVTVQGDGKVQTKEVFAPMSGSIQFAFTMDRQIFHTGFFPNYGASGWNDLKKSIVIRNRITHPKSDVDLLVDDGEMQTVRRGCQWYLDNATSANNIGDKNMGQVHDSLIQLMNSLPQEQVDAITKATNYFSPAPMPDEPEA